MTIPVSSLNARNLVVVLEWKSGLKLFGGVRPFTDSAVKADIPGGDLRRFLAPRLERVSLSADGLTDEDWMTADRVILAAARTLPGVEAEGDASPEASVRRRIAIEYMASLFFARPEELVPFGDYLRDALELRRAYKRFNQVAKLNAAAAFDKPYADWRVILEDAPKALAEVKAALMGHPHLRTLRTRVSIFPVYNSDAYKRLAELDPALRRVAIATLIKALRITGSPLVNADRVEAALSEIRGNALLSGASPSGLSIETVTNALGISLFGEKMEQMEDENVYEIENVSLAELGSHLAGLNSFVERARIRSIGEYGIKIELISRDFTHTDLPQVAVVDLDCLPNGGV